MMCSQLGRAAKIYLEESHQVAAWNYLESQIPDDVLDEFFELYCAGIECLFDADGKLKEPFSALN